MSNKLIVLAGQDFGIWHVVEQAPRRDNKTRWLCVCLDCGARVSMRSTSLRAGAYARCFGTHNRRAGVPSPLRKSPGYAAGTEVFGRYKSQAGRRGYVFLLSREQFQELVQLPCHYCGALPSQRNTRRHFNGPFVYNGIDRKDSGRGYEVENCLPCCVTCNVMKQDLPYAVFLAHVAQIAELHGSHAVSTGHRMAMGRGGNTRVAWLDDDAGVPV